MFGGSSQLPTTAERAVIKSDRRVQFRQHSRKLGGAAEHLIDGSPHVIEKRSKYLVVETITLKICERTLSWHAKCSLAISVRG